MTPALSDLRAFATVARLQSFAAAAKTLHLSQPALSRRIAKLEEQLGVRLLDRTTRSVALTALGQRFLQEVGSLVEKLDRSVSDLRDTAHLEAGDVTLGCVFSAVHHFLPAVIRSFRERHPNVLVRIIEEGADEVLACVQQGEADFGLNYIGMQEPQVSFEPLLREPYVLACGADHALARRREVPWTELAAWDQVRVSQASRNRLFIDQALAHLPPLPRPVCEVRHVSTLIGMVEAGLGVAVVPRLALPDSRDRVVGVALVDPIVTRTIGLIQRVGRSLSPAAQALSALVVEASRNQPATRARRARLAPGIPASRK